MSQKQTVFVLGLFSLVLTAVGAFNLIGPNAWVGRGEASVLGVVFFGLTLLAAKGASE